VPKLARRAVFLDRDGVLNRALVRAGKPYAPRAMRDFRLLPGAAEAVRRLKAAGFLAIVVTNQPDIGNGLLDAQSVAAMHARLRARIPVDAVLVCPHAQSAGCVCRKPKPGLLLRAARRWRIDLKNSYFVGDRWNDIVAGKRAGVYVIHLDRGYAETLVEKPDSTAKSLRQAVELVLRRQAASFEGA